MELLILGDSLPFGRPSHGICRDKTWPYLVMKALNSSLCFRAKGGSTILDVLSEVKVLEDYWFGTPTSRLFDAAIVQVGIVDVCPRIAPYGVYQIAKNMPGFHRVNRSRRLHQLVGNPYVSSHRFSTACKDLLCVLERVAKNVVVIEIARPANYLISNVGDFSQQVGLYNKQLRDCFGSSSFLNCWGGLSVPHYLLPDGHHLNLAGHKIVAATVISKIVD